VIQRRWQKEQIVGQLWSVDRLPQWPVEVWVYESDTADPEAVHPVVTRLREQFDLPRLVLAALRAHKRKALLHATERRLA
jgi:hypothetical protein